MRHWILRVAIVGLAGGCASGVVPLHTLDSDALYERGMSHLAERKWDEARRSFEYLLSAYPGHPKTEEVRYRIGEAYFGAKEYVVAASEMVRLVSDYPTGEYADDARYLTCRAYTALSPKPQLDQEYTRAAIEHCEALAMYHPTSEFAEDARKTVDALYEKLAEKTYRNGDYYYRRHAYDSAIIYFEELLRLYPRSSFAPRSLLRLAQTYATLGYKEELEAVLAQLARDFPDSPEAERAREINLASGG